MSRSSDAREGAALEGQADGVDGSDRASARGFDDRSDVGVERRAPFASKAVGDLTIDRAGGSALSEPLLVAVRSRFVTKRKR